MTASTPTARTPSRLNSSYAARLTRSRPLSSASSPVWFTSLRRSVVATRIAFLGASLQYTVGRLYLQDRAVLANSPSRAGRFRSRAARRPLARPLSPAERNGYVVSAALCRRRCVGGTRIAAQNSWLRTAYGNAPAVASWNELAGPASKATALAAV